MMTLTLNRRGEYLVNTFGPNHCGTEDSFVMRYELICECAATTTDRGFLFDQTGIQKYFEKRSMTNLSCERYAMTHAKAIFVKVREENPKIRIFLLKLKMSPAPFAAQIECSVSGTPLTILHFEN